MKRALMWLVGWYRRWLSPMKGHPTCRFLPTCSEYALEAVEHDRYNQPALAYLGVAWRLLGDAREHWLCDYERLVSEVTLEVSGGPGDVLVPAVERLTEVQAVKELEGKAGAPIAIKGFVRYALGEGIEKATSDFAAEVAAAVKG